MDAMQHPSAHSTSGRSLDGHDNVAVNHGHYENFPVASLLCPARLRPPILAIYRFARTADDIADEGDATPEDRVQTLKDYAVCLDAAMSGAPIKDRWPEVFRPLAQIAQSHALPSEPLHDLLRAFTQDCGQPLYADRAHLLNYCRRSANPIGRLLLHLYAIDDPRALAQSDAVCTALQLINFWQDPSVDLRRGRNYFPLQDLQRHGLTHEDVQSGKDTPATQAVLRDLTQWAAELMTFGSPLVHQVPGRLGWELRLVIQGGLRIIAKITQMNHRTLTLRPHLTALDYPVMLWQAIRISSSHLASTGERP